MQICQKCGGAEHALQTRQIAMKIGRTSELQVSGLAEVFVCGDSKCGEVFLPFVWEYGPPVNLVVRDAPPAPRKGKGTGRTAKKKRRRS